ncbi:transposase [Caldicellulosiruptor acetigenus 6A]|uniref:Transposase n=1 Tax=Caldicellulosiruptor acetigenus 6A TaxID=632516 RepID=G2PYW8_9FIRM|nr:transposase [Caldicellulosiruptor acetigenus 6A]
MLTIQAKLIFDSSEEKQKVLNLIRKWSSCMRYAYKRLLEGYERNELKRQLQGIFNLNSRYVDDAQLSPDRVLRDMSVLKSLLVSWQVGRPT